MRSRLARCLECVLLVLAVCVLAAPAAAEDAGPTPADAAAPAPEDPRLGQLRALVQGTLETAVDPQSLFDVRLSDETALQVEAARVRALLQALEPPAPPAPARKRADAPAVQDAGSPLPDLDGVDALEWKRRLALDRARCDDPAGLAA